MYEVFYNLKAEPFRLSPDHRFCYEHKGYARARAYMAYAFMRAEGFVMITGRPGTGKTTLVGELVESLARDNVCTANLVCTQLEADDLLKTVAYHFGVAAEGIDKAEILQRLEVLFNRWHREGRRALLIVDEAQDLSASAMEELRLLTNIQANGQPLLQIFLLGQPELRDLILSPPMEQVHQRIVAASHLEGLEAEEVEEYILHRLRKVGWDNDPLIHADVFPLIHKYSEGVPRRINLICSRLFLHGGVEQRHHFGLDDLRLVIDELQGENLAAGTRMSLDDFDVPSTEDEVVAQSAEKVARNGEPSQGSVQLRAVTDSEAVAAEQEEAAPVANHDEAAPVEHNAGRSGGAKKKDLASPSPKAPKKLASNSTDETAALVEQVAERELQKTLAAPAVSPAAASQTVTRVAPQSSVQPARSELEATVEQISSDFRKVRKTVNGKPPNGAAPKESPTAETAVNKAAAVTPAPSQKSSRKRMPPSTRRSAQGAARAARAEAEKLAQPAVPEPSRQLGDTLPRSLRHNSVTRYLAFSGLAVLGIAILMVWLPRLGVDEVVWAPVSDVLTPEPVAPADAPPEAAAEPQPAQVVLPEPLASPDAAAELEDANRVAEGESAVREAALSAAAMVSGGPAGGASESVPGEQEQVPVATTDVAEAVEIVLPLDTSQVATTLQIQDESLLASDLPSASPEGMAEEAATVSGELASALDVVEVELPSVHRVSFAFDSIVLEEVALDVLDDVLRILNADFDSIAAITGFADSSGNAVYNLDLSWDRARVVEEYLVAAGVARHRLKVQGRGAAPRGRGATSADDERLRVVQIEIERPER